MIRKYSTIEDLLFSSRNAVIVEQDLGQFNDLFKMLLSVHEECNGLQQDEERQQDDEWFDEIDSQVFSFKRKIHAWLRDVSEKKQSSRSSSKGSRSSSSKSGKSKSSKDSRETKSSKEKEIKDKIKVAELMAEAELLEEKQILETEARKLKIKEELAKAKARLSGYHDVPVDYIQTKQENAQQRWENQKEKVSSARDQKHQQTKNYSEDQLQNAWDKSDQRMKEKEDKFYQKTSNKKMLGAQDDSVNEMMCRLLKQQSAPEIEIDVFDGNPMEFHYFMAVFREVVEKRVDDERGKLTRLIKYTKGDAKDMVKNCIQLPPKDGFKTAKHLLNERYGNPHRIIAAYRREIKQWPHIKSGDAVAYQKFQNLLIKCENIGHLQSWNVFDTPDIMCMLLSKLPGSARDKWSRKVLTIRQNQGREPELSDFIKFVDNETLIVSDPLFSKAAVDEYLEKRSNQKRNRISAFATREQSKKGNSHVCINCNENHKLEKCKEFMEKTLKERIKFLMQQKRCYGCLEPMSDGHNAKTCTSKLTCSTCKGNHPTPLHGYVPKDKRGADCVDQDPRKTEEALKNSFAGLDDLKCAATSKEHGSNVISMCVVPVKM